MKTTVILEDKNTHGNFAQMFEKFAIIRNSNDLKKALPLFECPVRTANKEVLIIAKRIEKDINNI